MSAELEPRDGEVDEPTPLRIGPSSDAWSEALIAVNHSRLVEILETSPPEESRKSSAWWPEGGRCPGTNIASIMLGVDCDQFARVFFSRGFETTARVRSMLENIFRGPDMRRFLIARRISIDTDAAFENATERLTALALDQQIVKWEHGRTWRNSQVEREKRNGQ